MVLVVKYHSRHETHETMCCKSLCVTHIFMSCILYIRGQKIFGRSQNPRRLLKKFWFKVARPLNIDQIISSLVVDKKGLLEVFKLEFSGKQAHDIYDSEQLVLNLTYLNTPYFPYRPPRPTGDFPYQYPSPPSSGQSLPPYQRSATSTSHIPGDLFLSKLDLPERPLTRFNTLPSIYKGSPLTGHTCRSHTISIELQQASKRHRIGVPGENPSRSLQTSRGEQAVKQLC
ncbi:hypothetical protein BD324DRAFT_100007 [Kockovaella imperatae]|uniref:Uncharacterized protein n=1 Tax=Kockovaella imperatae TaxID=4999 RepID=A0A1Y1UBN3_9TREE|nr:hypothetical protein BD324DRAFT_100007 [Kockovaella imperatae]ORX35453.1 hypothetical protein BD324DRAFT_100007 [Kockovaella imperatae]